MEDRELEDLAEEDRQRELETILMALKTRKLDDYSAGVLNARLIALLLVGRGGKLSMTELAKNTNQARRSFFRRVQVARELAPPEMKDLREAVTSGEIKGVAALELVELRRSGQVANARSLKVLRSMRERKKMSAEDQAELRGFCEGVRWAHKALLQEEANSDWIAALAHDWRESKR